MYVFVCMMTVDYEKEHARECYEGRCFFYDKSWLRKTLREKRLLSIMKGDVPLSGLFAPLGPSLIVSGAKKMRKNNPTEHFFSELDNEQLNIHEKKFDTARKSPLIEALGIQGHKK